MSLIAKKDILAKIKVNASIVLQNAIKKNLFSAKCFASNEFEFVISAQCFANIA